MREDRTTKDQTREDATDEGKSKEVKTKRKRKTYPKHVFCIEGDWFADFNRTATVRPVLELLRINAGVNYIYRDCSTLEEMLFLIDKWRQKGHAAYKILYLAFHGSKGVLLIDSRHQLTLQELGERLEGRCRGRIIYFGACSVLAAPTRSIKKFLRMTGAKGVCGYTHDVDWMKSAALDLLAINELQQFSMTQPGLAAVEKSIAKGAKVLSEQLGFRMVYS